MPWHRPRPPVRYIERTRDYYRALGYQNDYVWARFRRCSLRLSCPAALPATRIGLVTTASPPSLDNRDARGVRHVWSGTVAPPPPKLFTDNVAWDKEVHATPTIARASCRSKRCRKLVGHGVIGGLRARTSMACRRNTAHRKTLEQDAPHVLAGPCATMARKAAILCPL